MFRITEDPSSGSFVQYLAKITRMSLSCLLTWTRSVLWQHILTHFVCVCSSLYIQRVRICCHNTDLVVCVYSSLYIQ